MGEKNRGDDFCGFGIKLKQIYENLQTRKNNTVENKLNSDF